MEIGAAAYLTKPIDVSELLQKMDEFLLPWRHPLQIALDGF
jgi:DNA-binding response OmpR family regulator